MYTAFYYAVVPEAETRGPIYPQFVPCEKAWPRCSYLNASTALKSNRLMSGQAYALSVHIRLPDSPRNREAGMFMTCAELVAMDGASLRRACKSALLPFKSDLLRSLETLAKAPLLISGHLDETTSLRLEFFSDYAEDPMQPAANFQFEVKSRYVEIYDAEFAIHANFAGIRYLMFHYPLTSLIAGTLINTFTLALIALLSWLRFDQPQREVTGEEEAEAKDEQSTKDNVENIQN